MIISYTYHCCLVPYNPCLFIIFGSTKKFLYSSHSTFNSDDNTNVSNLSSPILDKPSDGRKAMKDRSMLFAAIQPRSSAAFAARNFSSSSVITPTLLCVTIDKLLLKSSRLCLLCNNPNDLKMKLKSPGYVFSPYELKNIARDY